MNGARRRAPCRTTLRLAARRGSRSSPRQPRRPAWQSRGARADLDTPSTIATPWRPRRLDAAAPTKRHSGEGPCSSLRKMPHAGCAKGKAASGISISARGSSSHGGRRPPCRRRQLQYGGGLRVSARKSSEVSAGPAPRPRRPRDRTSRRSSPRASSATTGASDGTARGARRVSPRPRLRRLRASFRCWRLGRSSPALRRAAPGLQGRGLACSAERVSTQRRSPAVGVRHRAARGRVRLASSAAT